MQAESLVQREHVSRFLAGWILASVVPALPLIAIETQTVLLLDSPADERQAGLLSLFGIGVFLVLLAGGNWLFMRHRAVQPIAWGAMTIIGSVFGLAVAILVAAFGPELVPKWYFATPDDLIDSPLPPSQMTALLVTGGAGIAFGFSLGLFQAIALPFSMLSRLAWLIVSTLAVLSAFLAVFLLDLGYADILDLLPAWIPPGRSSLWSPRISADVVIAILIYALPTGLTLCLQLRRGLLQPRALVDRFD